MLKMIRLRLAYLLTNEALPIGEAELENVVEYVDIQNSSDIRVFYFDHES